MGSTDGRDLERHRPYLDLLARMSLGPKLRAKVSGADVVQRTLCEAVATPERFQGRTEPERLALLRKMLLNNAAKVARDLHRQKRDIDREQSLEAALERSRARLLGCFADDGASPSERAIDNERLLAVAEALADLAEAQREVVLLHFVEGLSTSEIARHLDRSADSITGLLRRGLRSLRASVGAEP